MKIGGRRIMRCEGSVLDEITVLGNFADIFAANEIRLGLRAHVSRANLFCVDVVNTAIGNVETDIAVDSHMAYRQHFVCARIVLRVVGVDICVAYVNGHVVARGGQPVLVTGFPG